MKSYIVMQGETYEEEKRNGHLITTKSHRNGTKNFSFNLFEILQVNDVIFHYSKGYFVAMSTITEAIQVVREEQFEVKTNYYEFDRPLALMDIFIEAKQYMPLKYAPFQQDGSGNSGYLYSLNYEFTMLLLKTIKQNVMDQLIQPTLIEETSHMPITVLQLVKELQMIFIQQERSNERIWMDGVQALSTQSCVICETKQPSLLVYERIKQKNAAFMNERFDVTNGIALCHNDAALFKQGLVTIATNGLLLVSEQLIDEQFTLRLYEGKKVNVLKEQKKYLRWHKKEVFQP